MAKYKIFQESWGWDGWMASLTRWRVSEWTPGVGDGQGGLACRDSWGCKASDTTEQLNWAELNWNVCRLMAIAQIMDFIFWVGGMHWSSESFIHPYNFSAYWCISMMGINFACVCAKSSFLYYKRCQWYPGRSDGKEPTCQYRRQRFDPWVGKVPWRRAWQPTPVSLSGESHGQRSLVGYSPWSYKELDKSEAA